ncbi:glycosyl hydrolase family 61-domain-containing protein [Podospora aff. communis PSN243]|uniref:lytic cellulose monooxygenase (C4-dehydrogenating) n=1 Tax=Podospora aff. communis PSN243 TaxID=3040156 RepID=A0AAV9GFT7_9PEZI|nr:glycosyl hydrolase family 61-domain-containing protein [Podospora aff. communis PSN243]
MTRSLPLLVIASLASTALAHSHIKLVYVENELYQGYDPRPNFPNFDNRVVWQHNAPDQGWVNGSHYNTPDIACHRDAVPPVAHAPVTAGQAVGVHWAGWPRIHKGPVLSYIAPCTGTNDGCASVDSASLKWTVVDNAAPGQFSTQPDHDNGTWASDFLIGQSAETKPTAANYTWQVRLPAGLKPGPYVLRNEIISLHYGNVPEEGGAQHYPFCVNIFVSAPTGATPAPFNLQNIASRDLYEVGHPGLFYDIAARPMPEYVLPGPPQAPGADPVRPQDQYDAPWDTGVKDGAPVKVQGTTAVPFVAKRTAEAFAA